MKKLVVLIVVVSFCFFNQGLAQNNSGQNLTPTRQLPKDGEVKTFHELDAKYDYELFNRNGKKLDSGNAQFIEITNLKPGVYFLRYNKTTKKLVID